MISPKNEENSGPRKMTKDDYKGMYHFVCECGGSMAINGQTLEKALFGDREMYIKCPNTFYGKCSRSYSVRVFREKAHFIPPPKFQEA